ncbi:MAG: 3'-5' exonuclease [Verrucomicrobia bacterium]|nr:3'-5' exonuclease [Verrucomicrobiota bacterium]
MRGLEQNFTVLDFESTGAVSGLRDEPWQIGLVQVAAGRVVTASAFESLLHVPDRPFSRHAPGRHAAIRDQLAAAPRLIDLWPTLRSRITRTPLVGHNVATEKRFLKSAFPLHARGPWVDTLKLVRLAHPDLASHKLAEVIAALGLSARVHALLPGREPHDALYDAMCCAVLFEALLHQPAWHNVTLTALAAASPTAFHRQVAARRRK